MNTTDLTRRLSAILSADVEGYSLLMREDEEATVHTLTAYRTAMTHLINQYRGRVVDSPGDNLLAEFTSVVDAVNCGVELQRELAERNAELPENRRMKFRIGINLGDVLQERNRIYGDGVNIAARMEGLAEAGGISISGTVYDAIENKIGLEYEYLGEQEVKNIDKPVRAYRVLSYPGAAAHRVVKAKQAVGRTWRNVVLAIAAVLILGGGALAIWHFYFRPPPIEVVTEAEMAFPLPDRPSIAVLPFVNVSGDPEQDYIADGITEQIIATLARNPLLFIIASNSTFTYKGKPVKVQQVSRELGVRYVVEGSVQKSGDKIRITAQLIDATTGEHLWAETYDRDLKDIFALQDEITLKILRASMGKLLGLEAHHKEKGTTNVEAYLKVLKASTLFDANEPNNRLAQQMFEESIAMDPKFATAYAMLGFTYWDRAMNGWSESPGKDMKKAFALAQKAIGLDQSLAGAHLLLGWIYITAGKHNKAIAEAKKAVALVPNNAENNATLGNFLAWGADKPEDAISVIKKALRLNPFPTRGQLLFSGNVYYVAGRYEEALSYFKKVQERNPDYLWAYLTSASIYGQLGREKEAHAAVKEILRIDPKSSVNHWEKMGAWSKKRETWDQWIDGLRKAGLPEEPPLLLPDKPSIAVLPFTNISDDPKQEYFSDGMTDTLITDLSKVSGLFVIARNSVFTYKGKSVKVDQIGRELGVRYVMEGSVQKARNQVRINVQLIDAKTGGHLWAERYDGKMNDIFALQDEIIGKIVSALSVKLTPSEQEQVAWKGTDDVKAYDAFLKGQEHFLHFTAEDVLKAIFYLKKAIELDPTYGQAYAALGLLYFDAYRDWTGLKWPDTVMMARKYMDLSMKNPGPYAYRLAGRMKLRLRLYSEALSELERGLALAPNDPAMHQEIAEVLNFVGRPKRAIVHAELAMRHDPRRAHAALFVLGLAYFSMDELEQAAAYFERSLTHNPKLKKSSLCLASIYALLGRDLEARDAFYEYNIWLGWRPKIQWIMHYFPWKTPEVADRFAEGLRKAGMKGKPYYRILEKNRLSGAEIKELVFGREFCTSCRHAKAIYTNRTKDGTIKDGGEAVGKSRIDGNMLCNKWYSRFDGLQYCGTVFSNPEGTSNLGAEYLYVTDFQTCELIPMNE